MPAILQALVANVGRRINPQEKPLVRKVAGKTGAGVLFHHSSKTNALYLDHESEFSVINNGRQSVRQSGAKGKQPKGIQAQKIELTGVRVFLVERLSRCGILQPNQKCMSESPEFSRKYNVHAYDKLLRQF